MVQKEGSLNTAPSGWSKYSGLVKLIYIYHDNIDYLLYTRGKQVSSVTTGSRAGNTPASKTKDDFNSKAS